MAKKNEKNKLTINYNWTMKAILGHHSDAWNETQIPKLGGFWKYIYDVLPNERETSCEDVSDHGNTYYLIFDDMVKGGVPGERFMCTIVSTIFNDQFMLTINNVTTRQTIRVTEPLTSGELRKYIRSYIKSRKNHKNSDTDVHSVYPDITNTTNEEVVENG